MSRRVLFLALIALCVAPLRGQERITLTTPETTPNNTAYRIDRVTLISNDPGTAQDDGFVHIQLTGIDQPNTVVCSYTATTSPTGTFLVNALNKANLSSAYVGNATTGSLKQRILHRLVILGEAATVCDRPLNGAIDGTVP